MTFVSLLAASLKRQLKQPQETSEFVLVYAAYLVTAKKALPTDFHPEMKIRSSFTPPSISSKPVYISLFCCTQGTTYNNFCNQADLAQLTTIGKNTMVVVSGGQYDDCIFIFG